MTLLSCLQNQWGRESRPQPRLAAPRAWPVGLAILPAGGFPAAPRLAEKPACRGGFSHARETDRSDCRCSF